MKSSIATRQVISTVDEANTGKFTIADTAQAFQVLIDGLYSDKIRAVIRELWSNAFDAHVAAGTPEQAFDCELPTVFNPVFSVRDYGISLNHEDTMGLYTTIFKSSKEGTNSQVGKFGLGSKSPFAYEDTFSVTTWNTTSDFTTEQRDYSCFIGEDGVPRITMMNVQESTEPRGLKVAFPVRVKDVEAFADRAEKVAIGFTVKPHMIGRHIDFASYEVVMEDEGLWQLCAKDSDAFQEGMAYARQGCVVYPINADSIPGITSAQAAVLRSPFFINFPIGDLDITASRESLSYKANTCRNILTAADIIIEEVRSRFSEQMKGAPTYLDACKLFIGLQAGSLHDSLKKMLLDGLTWRGRKLTTQISLERVLTHPYVKGKVKMTRWDGPSYSSRRKRQLRWEETSYCVLNVNNMPVIYLEDTRFRNPHMQGKIRYDFECRKEQGGYGAVNSLVWVKADPTSYAWKRVYATMGGRSVTVIDAAALPKPPPDKTGYIKKPTRMRLMRSSATSFAVMDVYDEEDHYYVDMERGDYIGHGTRSCNEYTIREARDLMIKLGLMTADAQIVAVPRTCKAAIKRNPHWVRFWDVVDQSIDGNLDLAKVGIAQACQRLKDDDDFDLVRLIIDGSIKLDHEDRSVLHKLRLVYERVVQRLDDHQSHLDWYALAQKTRYNLEPVPHKIRWQPLHAKVEKTYPLMKLLGNYTVTRHLPEIAHYVNLVDKQA